MGRWTTPHSGETKGWRRRTQYSDAHVARVIFDFPSSSLGQQNKIQNHHRSAGCRKSGAAKGLCSDGFVGCCCMVRLRMWRCWGFIIKVGATFGTVWRSRCAWRPKVVGWRKDLVANDRFPHGFAGCCGIVRLAMPGGWGFHYGVRATLGSVPPSRPASVSLRPRIKIKLNY